jgi:hypothetical protein
MMKRIRRPRGRVNVLRRLAFVASVSILMLVLPSTAHAEPGTPTFCGGWDLVGDFQQRACVIYESSTLMGFRHEIENMDSAAHNAYVRSQKIVTNSTSSSVSNCKTDTVVNIPAFSTRSFSCFATRHTGYKYRVDGAILSPQQNWHFVSSPTKTG